MGWHPYQHAAVQRWLFNQSVHLSSNAPSAGQTGRGFRPQTLLARRHFSRPLEADNPKGDKSAGERHQNPLAEHFRRSNVSSEKKGIGPDVGALIRAKNDYKHDRGPTTEQHLIGASNESHERIEKCIQALSFFKEYPIRLVQDFDVDRYDDDSVLKCLRLTGDGPGSLQVTTATLSLIAAITSSPTNVSDHGALQYGCSK